MSGSQEENGTGGAANNDNTSDPAALKLAYDKAKADLEALRAKVGDGTTLPDWMQRRLDSMTARLRTEEEAHARTKAELGTLSSRVTTLQSELAQARGTPAGNPSGNAPTGGGQVGVATPSVPIRVDAPADFDAAVAQRAEELRQAEARVAAENESAERGKQVYGETFDTSISNLKNLGQLPPAFIDAAMATGAAEHVLFKLGNDLSLASRIASLPPIKMAIEMAKLTAPPPPPPKAKASTAEAPMTPVGSGGPREGGLRDDLPSKDWMAARDAQIKARKEAGRRRA